MYRQPKNTLPQDIDPELQEIGYTPKIKHTSVHITCYDDLKFADYSGYNDIKTKHKCKKK